jgi:hypothetical protein
MTDTPNDKTSPVVPPPLPAGVSPSPAVEPPPVPGGSLQFDRAEFGQPAAMSCSSCQRSIDTEYYAVNGATVCATCHPAAAGGKGTSVSRALRAGLAGGVAAFAGGLLYFLIAYFTGYEIGLIAIAVGFAVGVAVRWGSYGRGGAFYQAMAMSLTYLAIVGSLMVAGIMQIGAESDATDTTTTAASVTTNAGTPVSLKSEASPSAEPGSSEDGEGFLFSLVMLIGLTLALPFLAGFENIIGIVIIGIGVYEAWKINRRPDITGPHPVGTGITAVS